jgi:hypothetical protein
MRSRSGCVLGVAVLSVMALSACTSSHNTQTRYEVVPAQAAHVDMPTAYVVLHRLGFRVAIPDSVRLTPYELPTAKLTPAVGSRVLRGSTITLAPVYGPVGSPAVDKSNPHHRVPSFIQQPLADAIQWADSHDMLWAIPKLPALPASDAPHLFDAYRVVGQNPNAGSVIGQGVPHGHTYKPTPLTLTVVLTGAQ